MFDVTLNEHTVVSDLDIYDKVGLGTAHDEVVPFSISKGKVQVNGEVSDFEGNLEVDFVKVGRTNINCSSLTCLLTVSILSLYSD